MSYSTDAKNGNLSNSTLEELQHILITLDGLGETIKKKALDILIQMAYSKGVLGQEPIETKERKANEKDMD
jgi:hypothetical protein